MRREKKKTGVVLSHASCDHYSCPEKPYSGAGSKVTGMVLNHASCGHYSCPDKPYINSKTWMEV
jgi:hypothetical protein